MIIDTSAIFAILRVEPDHQRITSKLLGASSRYISAGTWIELEAVSTRSGDQVVAAGLERLLQAIPLEVVPVSIAQAALAREAYRIFGRGTRHPARLNFGDCFSYALARETELPLLFKGDGFIHTDIVSAL